MMIKLSNRLQACADFVRQGTRLADIGCDHGYVPVYLLSNGRINSAIAADINEGPLSSCRQLVEKNNLQGKINCVLSNGLEKISENEIDDIIIAGMGGELIAEILGKCSYIQKKHLILNPMTHPEPVRRWLYDNGFEIQNDIIVSDGRHFYSVFDAYYTGKFEIKSEADYYLGNITDFSQREYFQHLLNYLRNREKGGEDFTEVISSIESRLNDDNS